MFEIRNIVEFPASHHIEGYQGDCSRPHGHNWKLEVILRIPRLNSIGLSVDFRELKTLIQDLVGRWDHQDLNMLEEFRGINPTAETVAKTAYDELSSRLRKMVQSGDARLHQVRVWENDRCYAAYWDESEK